MNLFSKNSFLTVISMLTLMIAGQQMALAGDDLTTTMSVVSNFNGEDVSCVGSCNGSAIINHTGGVAPFTYLWSDGQTTQVATDLCAGVYTATVTDFNGCEVMDTIELFDPPDLLVSTVPFEYIAGYNVSCNGEMDGEVTGSASGGVGPYTFLWSDGQTGTTAIDLPAGMYFLQVTDDNFCIASDTFDLTEPEPLSADSSLIKPISCLGLIDGGVDLEITGGNGSYFYEWADGPLTVDRSDLDSGTYTVLVTDIVGCSLSADFFIDIVEPLEVSIKQLQYETCIGAEDGAIDIDVEGGTPPYSYAWNTGVITQDVGGLFRENYFVTVTDSNGCSSSLPISVGLESRLTISTLSVLPGCNAADGLITAEVAGAVGVPTFEWSDGQTSPTAIDLEAGVYTITVSDDECSLTEEILLDNHSSQELTVTHTNTACGALTGTAIASPSGGNPPYAYLWSDGQTTQTATTLGAGQYIVEVTGAGGCKSLAYADIMENNDLAVDVDVVLPEDCGYNNATVTLNPTAGTAPYTYQWSNGGGDAVGTTLSSGLIQAIVTDLANCKDTLLIPIKDPGAPDIELLETATLCGLETGMAEVVASGGVAPYSYVWSSGDTTENIVNVQDGVGFVMVKDAERCMNIERVEIEGSMGVDVEARSNGISCESLDDGSIDLTVVEGVPDYLFAWATGETTEDIFGLSLGEYEVSVIDLLGCQVTGLIPLGDGCNDPLVAVDDYVTTRENITIIIDVLFNDTITDRGDIVVTIITDPLHGTATVLEDGTINYSPEDGFLGLDSFQYLICNGSGLCDSAWVYMTVNPQFFIPNAFSPNNDGINDMFFISGIDEFPNNELIVFNRWGDEVFKQSSYMGDWNGIREGGKEVPDATYYYVLDLGNGEDPLSGYVVIHR